MFAMLRFRDIVGQAMEAQAERGRKDHGEKQACNQDGSGSDGIEHLSLFYQAIDEGYGFRIIPLPWPQDSSSQSSARIDDHSGGQVSDHQGLGEFLMLIP